MTDARRASRGEAAQRFRSFARQECGTYAPLYAAVCEGVADDTEVLDVVLEARPDVPEPNLVLAAVRYLLLRGLDHPLGALHPDVDPAGRAARRAPRPATPREVYGWFREVVLANRAAVGELLRTRVTQTNEVGRCAALAPAVAELGAGGGSPRGGSGRRRVALVDVGASAGLNLQLDRYRYELGGRGAPQLGDAASAVVIRSELRGRVPPPRYGTPLLTSRVGVDREPVDVRDPDAVLWLRACVWPEHPERVERLTRALELAAADPPPVVKGDAVDDLAGLVLGAPPADLVVVVTAFTLAYLPRVRRQAFVDTVGEVARRREVAWVSLEGAGVVPGFDDRIPPAPPGTPRAAVLRVTSAGPLRARTVVRAHAHPHGAWVRWRPGESGVTTAGRRS